MNLNIKLDFNKNQIKITDETVYFNLDAPSLNQFTFLNTVGILMLGTRNKKTGIVEYSYKIYEHSTIPFPNVEMFLDLVRDGRYTISYIVLPLERIIPADNNPYYYAVASGNTYEIYKRFLNKDHQLIEEKVNDLKVLTEVNPDALGLSRITEDEIFSLYNLRQCYINICKKILELKVFCDCDLLGPVDKMLICNRDLLLMALNIITYLIELELFNEAERILNIILDCNGVCKLPEIESDSVELCGCCCS